jgi:protease IV
LAGIEAKDSVTLKSFPEATDPLTAFGQALGASATTARTTARAAAVVGAVMGDERVASLLATQRAGASGASGASMSESVRVK